MLQPVTIGIPTFSPLFRAGFFHPCRCVPGSKLLGEIGFQRSPLRIALFSSAYFKRCRHGSRPIAPYRGDESDNAFLFCQSKPVFELFEKFFIQLFVLYVGKIIDRKKVAVVYAAVAKGVQPLQNPII